MIFDAGVSNIAIYLVGRLGNRYRIIYSYTLLGRRISRFIQSRQVISDEAQPSSDIILARPYKFDIRQHNSV